MIDLSGFPAGGLPYGPLGPSQGGYRIPGHPGDITAPGMRYGPDFGGYPASVGGGVVLRPILAPGGSVFYSHIGNGRVIVPRIGTPTAGFLGTINNLQPFTYPAIDKRAVLTNGLGQAGITEASGSSFYYTSDCGASWSTQTLPTGGFLYSQTVATVNDWFICIYGSNVCMNSHTAGRTWTNRTLPHSINWRQVAVLADGTGLAIAESTSSGAITYNMGDTWSAYTFPYTPANYCYMNAVGNRIFWNPVSSGNRTLFVARGAPFDWRVCRFAGNYTTSSDIPPPVFLNGVYVTLDTTTGVVFYSDTGEVWYRAGWTVPVGAASFNVVAGRLLIYSAATTLLYIAEGV